MRGLLRMWYTLGMIDAQVRHAQQLAHLEVMGEDWQRRLALGDATLGWKGDRSLVMYVHPLTDSIIIKQESADTQPVMIMKIAREDFDINLAIKALVQADPRRRSADEVFDEVDAHNAALRERLRVPAQEQTAEGINRLAWALARDTGGSVAPQLITKGLR